MAPQKTTFAALRKAQATPANAQERLRIWILGNYYEDYLMSTEACGTVPLTRAEFDQLYVEPELERWALEPAIEPEATPESQRASSISTGFATRASSDAADISFSPWSDYACCMTCPKHRKSVPELPSEQSELDEVGSGYGADVSDNADSSQASSTTNSDSSSIQYYPDANSSDSDHSSSQMSSTTELDSSSVWYTPEEGSSDSDYGSLADPDSEAQSISSRVNEVTSREHHERSNAPQEREESSNSANEFPVTSSLPVNSEIAIVNQRLAELDRAIDRARHILRNIVAHSRGEHLASVDSLEALEHEREQLSPSACCPHCPHCQLASQRFAELQRAIDQAHQFLHAAGAHSYGEHRAGVVSLEALEREREQLRSAVFYWHFQ